ncbi:pimeloyl-ACP methyl ester carboxylesterase [Streptomyces sp. V3I8]|uniref:alpha/beta fold hydrolase n=1 Tax=Streptomyces sp. V3I8 TaxID=3042279 RepID=UPI00277E84E1|nr:alpha/beta hydrolase [Streptomyces sp. V3I8]MDQ1040912.1 pimeloyl-ACP methyl ester carboxylesterase [Streptomyces sp. V3I8]
MSTIAVKAARLRSGLVLPYAQAGGPQGVPVVFVHGLADSWWTFEPLLRRLPAALHGYAPTQRGHGDAERPPHGYGPEDFAGDLVEFLDAAGIRRTVLAGVSSGGVAARLVAGSHPDRVAGLVLAGVPATLADKPGARALAKRVRRLGDPVPRAFVEELLSGLTARPLGRGLLATLADENLKVPARVWRETVRGLLETDLAATLRGILVPTLVLWGDADALLPRADQQRILDAVPGARLLVYGGAGHVLHQEAPERFVQDVAAFAAAVLPVRQDGDAPGAGRDAAP